MRVVTFQLSITHIGGPVASMRQRFHHREIHGFRKLILGLFLEYRVCVQSNELICFTFALHFDSTGYLINTGAAFHLFADVNARLLTIRVHMLSLNRNANSHEFGVADEDTKERCEPFTRATNKVDKRSNPVQAELIGAVTRGSNVVTEFTQRT